MIARFSEEFKQGKFTNWANILLAETRLSFYQRQAHFRFL